MRMLVSVLAILPALWFAPPALAAGDEVECVILLHGLARSQRSMSDIKDALLESGYRVWSETYASRTETVASLAQSTLSAGLAYCREQGATRVHMVSHSLGGLLIRVYLQDHEVKNLGRIVMLAPPNHGSEVADVLKDNSLYEWAMGPVGQELGTGENDLANRLKPIPGEIGVIAGNETSDPWFSPIIPGPDDGKVSVASTHLEEMKDFREVEAGHTFIMRNPQVIEQVLNFLRDGAFKDLPPFEDSSDLRDR